eukprot:4832563-Prymnesium_polylepis.1
MLRAVAGGAGGQGDMCLCSSFWAEPPLPGGRRNAVYSLARVQSQASKLGRPGSARRAYLG